MEEAQGAGVQIVNIEEAQGAGVQMVNLEEELGINEAALAMRGLCSQEILPVSSHLKGWVVWEYPQSSINRNEPLQNGVAQESSSWGVWKYPQLTTNGHNSLQKGAEGSRSPILKFAG